MDRLGHIVRKYRSKLTRRCPRIVEVLFEDMGRILDAADKGLYLSVAMPVEITAYKDTLRCRDEEYNLVKKDRDKLRAEYVEARDKIQAAGFQDVADVLGRAVGSVELITDLKKQVNALAKAEHEHTCRGDEWAAPYPEIEEAEGLPF